MLKWYDAERYRKGSFLYIYIYMYIYFYIYIYIYLSLRLAQSEQEEAYLAEKTKPKQGWVMEYAIAVQCI